MGYSYTVTRYDREGEIINHTGDGRVSIYKKKLIRVGSSR